MSSKMRRALIKARRFYRIFLVLDTRAALVIAALWAVLAAALELSNHNLSVGDASRYWTGVAAVAVNACVLLFVAVSLVRRLLEIIRGQRGAGWWDIGAVAFTYLIVVLAFAGIYLGWENGWGAETVFKFTNGQSYIRLVDYVYLSGLTITTVGYGDVSPVIWYAKLATVLEALTGLGLTAFVVGVFVSSLLGRQDLDRRTKFLTSFQRKYLNALEEHLKALNLAEKYLDEHAGGDGDYEDLDRQLTGFQESILKTVADLVQLQYEPSSTAKVTANWMRLYLRGEATPEELELAADFTEPDYRPGAGKAPWGVLVLQEWGERPSGMPGPEEFALPVYDPDDPEEEALQLQGAPEAVGSAEGYVIVSDASKVDFGRHHPSVRDNLIRYFKTRAPDLRSFASVRVDYEEWQERVAEGEAGGETGVAGAEDQGAPTLGVINIQSDEPDLCGSSPEVQQLLVDIIRPFARYLAKAELYRPTAGGGTT